MGEGSVVEKIINGLGKVKPYLAMVALQFGYAGMYIITMVSFNHGLSHWILSVYRHIVAFLVIAPFAFFIERYLASLSLSVCLIIYFICA